ncbi:hypothetical protein ACFYVL_40085 [Streptomyces sp. NPDC004111]|uniref:hypothetical protein n=1 Tax=Streptomyces sp. NPDC004111 TaxID=3364690 RepID=UPI0036BBE837
MTLSGPVAVLVEYRQLNLADPDLGIDLAPTPSAARDGVLAVADDAALVLHTGNVHITVQPSGTDPGTDARRVFFTGWASGGCTAVGPGWAVLLKERVSPGW